jgi:hypothetical protein
MTGQFNTTESSIDDDQTALEASPSTGWRETARALDAPGAHDVEPVDAGGCGALGCHADDPLVRVTTNGDRRVLCPDHAADFLTREVTA